MTINPAGGIHAANAVTQSLVSGLAPRQPRDISVVEGADLSPQAARMPASTGAGVSSDVRSLSREMAACPPVDTGKVAAIKAGIASGGYTLQPQKLADAMISSAIPG